MENYEIIWELGRGSFGVVQKVRCLKTQEIYVIKIIDVDENQVQEAEAAANEWKLLSQIDFPYIVKYRDSWLANGKIYLVMEYWGAGDLLAQIKRKGQLLETQVWKMWLQTCLGLEHLHQQKILHRDIKPANIFLTKSHDVKIGDLGLARKWEGSFASTVLGTPFYLAPELIKEEPYNDKSDVWGLGCVLYELWTGSPPFTATNQGALILKIIKGRQATITASFSPELKTLINRWLDKNWRNRPSIAEILKSIWQHALSLKVFIPKTSVLAPKAPVKIVRRINSREELRKSRPTIVKRDQNVPYGKKVRNKFKVPPPKTSYANRKAPTVNADIADNILNSDLPEWAKSKEEPPVDIKNQTTAFEFSGLQPPSPPNDPSEQVHSPSSIPSPPSEVDQVQRLQELEEQEQSLGKAISDRYLLCVESVGDQNFNGLYVFFSELINTDQSLTEEEIAQHVEEILGTQGNPIILDLYKLIYQEIEMKYLQETIRDLKFDLL